MNNLKKCVLALLFAMPLAATSAYAAADGKSTQNNKMKTCSDDFKATGKLSSERKAFMSICLKGNAGSSASVPSTDDAKANKAALTAKRKACNADATASGKKGAERKTFVKECLSK